MKNYEEIMIDIERTSRRIEEFRHRVAFLRADIRMTKYEKMANVNIDICDMASEVQHIKGFIKGWLELAKRGDYAPYEHTTTLDGPSVGMPDKNVQGNGY